MYLEHPSPAPVTVMFCLLDPSRLGWYSPSVAKHNVLHHPLLVPLNPTYTFIKNSALLFNSPQLSHGREPGVSCQDLKPHCSWSAARFFPLSLHWRAKLAVSQPNGGNGCKGRPLSGILWDEECFRANKQHVKPDGHTEVNQHAQKARCQWSPQTLTIFLI